MIWCNIIWYNMTPSVCSSCQTVGVTDAAFWKDTLWQARPNTLLSSISANFISLIQFRLFPLHSTTIRYSSNFCLSFLQFFVNPGIESKVQYNQELAKQFCWCLSLKSAVLQQSWSIAQIDLCTILVLTQLCKDFQLDKLPPNFGEMIERMETWKQPQPFAIFLVPYDADFWPNLSAFERKVRIVPLAVASTCLQLNCAEDLCPHLLLIY